MSLPIIIMLAICTVMAYLVTVSSIVGARRLIKWHVFHDVLFTTLCFFAFAGTLGGTLVAVMGGLIMAVTLKLAHSYYKWAKAKGYIVEPEKAPRKTRMTKAQAQEAVNETIHSNVTSIAAFLNRKAA